MQEKHLILIIDDSTQNIKILNDILKEDYAITVAKSGEKALSLLDIKIGTSADARRSAGISDDGEQSMPDIILLDIMMPGMDGYEVCKLIKGCEKTSDIPIIFITAKDDIKDEEKGLRLGAVDYITKPVSPPIVKARIKNHLLIKTQRDLLKNSISVLQHRAEILQHKAELGMLAAGLAHDINNVLFVAMMIDSLPSMVSDGRIDYETVKNQVKSTMETLSMGREICKGFTNYLNDLGEEEKIQLFPPLLKPLDMFEKTFKVKLYRDISSNLPYIKCKGAQIKRVIINLFINACQAVEKQRSKKLIMRAWHENRKIFFSIQDNGPGIPDDVMPHIFEEHYTTKPDGNGLGLSMVKKILESHQGTIECSTSPGEGTIFTLSLPVIEELSAQ